MPRRKNLQCARVACPFTCSGRCGLCGMTLLAMLILSFLLGCFVSVSLLPPGGESHPPGGGGSDRKLGMLKAYSSDYQTLTAGSGCALVDLDTKDKVVELDLSTDACGGKKCPPCFVLRMVQSEFVKGDQAPATECSGPSQWHLKSMSICNQAAIDNGWDAVRDKFIDVSMYNRVGEQYPGGCWIRQGPGDAAPIAASWNPTNNNAQLAAGWGINPPASDFLLCAETPKLVLKGCSSWKVRESVSFGTGAITDPWKQALVSVEIINADSKGWAMVSNSTAVAGRLVPPGTALTAWCFAGGGNRWSYNGGISHDGFFEPKIWV